VPSVRALEEQAHRAALRSRSGRDEAYRATKGKEDVSAMSYAPQVGTMIRPRWPNPCRRARPDRRRAARSRRARLALINARDDERASRREEDPCRNAPSKSFVGGPSEKYRGSRLPHCRKSARKTSSNRRLREFARSLQLVESPFAGPLTPRRSRTTCRYMRASSPAGGSERERAAPSSIPRARRRPSRPASARSIPSNGSVRKQQGCG